MPTNPGKAKTRSPLLIIPVTVFFAAGIIAARFNILPIPVPTTLAIIFFLAIPLLTKRFFSLSQIGPLFFLLPIFFLTGTLQPVNKQAPNTLDHIYNLVTPGEEVVITGILAKSPSWNGTKSKLLTQIQSIRHRDNSVDSGRGLVLLSMPFNARDKLTPGDTFLARAILREPGSYKNPGGIDYRKYLADKDIYLTGWVSSPSLILKVGLRQEIRLADKTARPLRHNAVDRLFSTPASISHKIHYLPERLRTWLNRLLAASQLPPQRIELYKALLTGSRSNIPPAILEDYKTSGVMHLLAISGLHVGILALLISGGLAWIIKHCAWLTRRYMVAAIALSITIIPLTLYAMIAGFQPPVIRALIMTITIITALIIQRPYCLATNITTAFLVILIFNPTSLFYPSLQLSFAAVISIAILYPIFAEKIGHAAQGSRLHKAVSWFTASICLSTAALIGTLPLTLFYFNRFSPISPISTLLISPPLCLWALPIGFIATIIAPFSLPVAAKLFTIGSWGIVLANFTAHLLARLPLTSIWLPTPSWLEISVYYASFIALAVAVRHHDKKYYRTSMILFLVLLGLHVTPIITKQFRRTTTVSYLDVGQGSSTLFELPGNYNILVDGGGHRGPNFDVGSRVIAPFLWQKKISSLTALIITHPHADHYNGLKFIVEKFSPATIWINGQPADDPLYRKIIAAAKAKGLQIAVPGPNETIFQQAHNTIKIVGNLHLSPARLSANRKSLVVKLTSNGVSFLLPGDIFKREEGKLLASGAELHSAVLLAPHHGSKTSSSPAFMDKVAPKIIVVSTHGRSRKYPDPQLIEACRERKIKMLITGQTGCVSLLAENGKVTRTTK